MANYMTLGHETSHEEWLGQHMFVYLLFNPAQSVFQMQKRENHQAGIHRTVPDPAPSAKL